jgi:hypothetical protein
MQTNIIKNTLFLSAVTVLLAACGGGDEGTAAQASDQPVAQADAGTTSTDCPTGYRSITLNQASIQGATLSLSAGNAAFSFKTPKTATPSIKICFGVAANPITDGGLTTLGDTYEIKTFALDSAGSNLSSLLETTLSVDFSLSKIPAGTSASDLVNKVNVFNDTTGSLAMTDKLGAGTFTGQEGTLDVRVSKDGRYVAAFKP